MSSVNKIILVGNIGHSPRTNETKSGTKITDISIATSKKWKDKETGEYQNKTEWHKVIFFNHLAEIAEQYLTKGSKVYVSGELQTRKYTGKDGSEKLAVEILGQELQMLSSREDNASDSPVNKFYKKTEQNKGNVKDDNFDDDIPF